MTNKQNVRQQSFRFHNHSFLADIYLSRVFHLTSLFSIQTICLKILPSLELLRLLASYGLIN